MIFIPLSVISQSPGGISTDLRLWLSADNGTSCTTDGCGITSWNNQSGFGHNATGTGNAVWNENFASFQPAIAFSDDPQPLTRDL